MFDAFICGYTDGRNYTADFAQQNLKVVEFLGVTKEFTHLKMFDFLISDEYTALMSMSPLFTNLLKYIDKRVQKDVNNIITYINKDPKIYMLSGHDTNLAAFMRFMKAVFQNRTELINPEFGRSVYLELVLNDDAISTEIPRDKYFVNVFVNEENIFNEAMNYTYFSEQIRKRIVKDQEIALFCVFKDNEKSEAAFASGLLVGLVVVFSVLAAGLFAWFMVIVFKGKSSIRGNEDDSLHTDLDN